MNAKCFCYSDFTGRNCEISLKKCPKDCSNNGICSNGTCICEKEFLGVDCSIKRQNCSFSGHYNDTTFQCECAKGFYGSNCQFKICDNNCSNQGKCQKDGTCICNKGFTGFDCSRSNLYIFFSFILNKYFKFRTS